jgi:hypothetical protein
MLLDHERVGALLPDYLNGLLVTDLQTAVAEHLASCEDCAAEYALLQEMTALEVPDPGELFWQTLPKRIAAQAERPVPWWQKLLESLVRPIPVAVMTALILAVMFVPFATRYLGQPEQKDIIASVERIDIPAQQIQEIAGIVADGDQEMSAFFESDDNGQVDYQQAIAALSTDEFDELMQELQKPGTSGGDA